MERGAFLMHQGDPGLTVCLLLAGFVKILGAGGDGQVSLLAIRVPGDLVGELAVLDGQPRSASVVAVGRCRYLSVPGGAFRALLADDPELAREVSRSTIVKLRMSARHRADVGAHPVPVRVARLLLHLAEVYGRPGPDGVVIDIPLTQPDLADLVAAGLASVERTLADLRADGILSTGYRRFSVTDPDRLRAAAAEIVRAHP